MGCGLQGPPRSPEATLGGNRFPATLRAAAGVLFPPLPWRGGTALAGLDRGLLLCPVAGQQPSLVFGTVSGAVVCMYLAGGNNPHHIRYRGGEWSHHLQVFAPQNCLEIKFRLPAVADAVLDFLLLLLGGFLSHKMCPAGLSFVSFSVSFCLGCENWRINEPKMKNYCWRKRVRSSSEGLEGFTCL